MAGSTDIRQLLPANVYQAAVNANTPSLANPFATILDITLTGVLAAGNTTADGQTIDAENGNGSLNLRNGADGKVKLSGDELLFEAGQTGVTDVGAFGTTPLASSMFIFKSDFSKIGEVAIYNNDGSNRSNFNFPSYPAVVSSQNGTMNMGVVNSVLAGGIDIIMKTDNTAYVNQIAFNSGEAFETILNYTTATANNTITFQDGSGTVAFLSDIVGGETLAQTLTLGNETGNNNIVLDMGSSLVDSPQARGSIVVKDIGSLYSTAVLYVENDINTGIDVVGGGTNNGTIAVKGTVQASIRHQGTNNGFTAINTGCSIAGFLTMQATTGFQLQNGANEIIFTANPTSNGLTQTFQDASGVIALTSDIETGQTYTVNGVPVTTRTIDYGSGNANSTRQILATLIDDLKSTGILI